MRGLGLFLSCIAGGAMAQGFDETFQNLDQTRWHVAEYDFTHPAFDTDWRRSQVAANDGLTLALAPHDGLNRFAGGSIRTKAQFQYGYYETRMIAAGGPGVVTGFFTYTGPHYGTRHDEIDIEILGKDTTKLHVAWFVDGTLTNHFIPLGFDAAGCVHDYGFMWEPHTLTWFVNSKPVYQHLAKDGPIPSVPGHLFANLWAADPSIAVWSDVAHPDTSTRARVDRVRFRPLGDVQRGS